MKINEITEQIIGAAIEVHRALGPGLLESAYEASLVHELELRNARVARQVQLPLHYKSVQLDCGYRMDLVVEDLVIVEVKAVEDLLPIHEAQLLTYLRLTDLRAGLLINFNVPTLKQGVRRLVNNFMEDSAPSAPPR
ncbi:MAG TPA: GxxExxY protein [Kiritimatiellia bacterium]|nr:GxxExxY protein [Kiritimatiellia bacterium]